MSVDGEDHGYRALSTPALFESPENSWEYSPSAAVHSPFCVDNRLSPELSPIPFLRDLPSQISIAPNTPVSISEASPLDSNQSLSSPISRLRDHKVTKADVAYGSLKRLQKAKLTLIDLLGYVVSGHGDFLPYHQAFFSEKNGPALLDILSKIFDDPKGADLTREWLLPRAVDVVCETIHQEMEQAKPLLRMNADQVTPDFIDNWDINKIMEPVERLTPTWSAVFEAAAESKSSKKKNKTAKSRNRKTVSRETY